MRRRPTTRTRTGRAALPGRRRGRPDPSRMPPRPGSFIPFGAGRHTCIGDAFAVAEILSAVASVARRWRLAHAPGTTVKEVPAGIPLPDALPMVPVPRR